MDHNSYFISQNIVKSHLKPVHRDIIGKYERDEVKPSIEVAVKIADALEVSLDYLVGKTKVEIDAKTLKRLQGIQSLNEQDKAHIFELLDAFLCERKNKKA